LDRVLSRQRYSSPTTSIRRTQPTRVARGGPLEAAFPVLVSVALGLAILRVGRGDSERRWIELPEARGKHCEQWNQSEEAANPIEQAGREVGFFD
jgi:hypothetical protein